MNFVDYCIATKNYSVLNTVNEYTKTFGLFDKVKNKLEATQRFLKKRTGSEGYLDSLKHLGRSIDAIRTGRQIRKAQDMIRKGDPELRKKYLNTWGFKSNDFDSVKDTSTNDFDNIQKLIKSGSLKRGDISKLFKKSIEKQNDYVNDALKNGASRNMENMGAVKRDRAAAEAKKMRDYVAKHADED